MTDPETQHHVESLPDGITEGWENRKTDPIAEYLGMAAYGDVANLRGFTAYMERELSDPVYDLEIVDGKRVWRKRNG